jgi:hypothetical protein
LAQKIEACNSVLYAAQTQQLMCVANRSLITH